MNLQPVIDALTASAAFGQVAAAPVSLGQPTVDTGKAIKTLLRDSFLGNFDPLTLGAEPTHPSMVYQLVSSGWLRLLGHAIVHTDQYVFYLRAEKYADLITVAHSVVTTIESSDYAIEVTDMLVDYDDQQKLYRCNMEIAFTQPVGNGALPAALVYPLGSDSAETAYDNCDDQLQTNRYAVVVLTTNNDLHPLVATATNALKGLQETPAHQPMQHQSGEPMETPGGLSMWHSVFFNRVIV